MAATVDQVARLCNITPQRVQQLVKEGLLPREARGEYDLVKCMVAYIRYLQKALSSRASMGEDGEIVSTQAQRSSILGIELEQKKLDLAKARSEVISVVDFQNTLAHLVIETKARIKAIAPRVAPQLLGETSRVMVQAKIDKAIDEALIDLSHSVPKFQRTLPPAPPAKLPQTAPTAPAPDVAEPEG